MNRLIRLSFGPFQLGELESGLVEEVRTKVLKEQLGTKLADEAGVDFESPVREPIAPFGSETRKAKGERPPRRDDRRDRDDRPTRRLRRAPRSAAAPIAISRAVTATAVPEAVHREAAQRSDERPRVGGRPERRPTVWRDGGEDRPRHKTPRRGEDPRAARAAAGERPRERVGAIKAPEGRKVLVERLVSQPRPEGERPPRHRRDARRPAPGGDDRPRRPKPPRDSGDRPPRRDREGFGDRAAAAAARGSERAPARRRSARGHGARRSPRRRLPRWPAQRLRRIQGSGRVQGRPPRRPEARRRGRPRRARREPPVRRRAARPAASVPSAARRVRRAARGPDP